MPSWAWVDESFIEENTGGLYVVAAAVIEPGAAAAAARVAMTELRGQLQGTGKLHWSQLRDRERLDAARVVAGLGGLHVVVVGSPVALRRQERARAKCLAQLAWELHSYDVERLVAERRTNVLDARDIVTVSRVRQQVLPKGSELRITHERGAVEPLLWIADVVAGAVRMSRLGNPGPRDELADCVYEVDVDADASPPATDPGKRPGKHPGNPHGE